MVSLIYALGSNIAFAVASVYFTEFSKKIGPAWMNYFKAFVAFICFAIAVFILRSELSITSTSFVFLALSGVVGLMIGDIFLLRAFTHLGSGRVLMIFGFQPLLLGIASFFLFSESFPLHRCIAIIFLMGCLFSFSLESFKERGHWDLLGLSFALVGVSLDACGLLLTKKAFDLTPNMSVFLANLIRSGATVAGFLLISRIPFFRFRLISPFLSLSKKERWTVIIASFLGTFLSLGLYLHAVQIGHLATISAVAGTSPVMATVFEIGMGRKQMTRYLAISLGCFVAGLAILVYY